MTVGILFNSRQRETEADYFDRTNATGLTLGAVLYAVDFYRAKGYEIVAKTTAWDGSGMYSTSVEKSITTTG